MCDARLGLVNNASTRVKVSQQDQDGKCRANEMRGLGHGQDQHVGISWMYSDTIILEILTAPRVLGLNCLHSFHICIHM